MKTKHGGDTTDFPNIFICLVVSRWTTETSSAGERALRRIITPWGGSHKSTYLDTEWKYFGVFFSNIFERNSVFYVFLHML